MEITRTMLGAFWGFLVWTARPQSELQPCPERRHREHRAEAFLAFLNNHRVPKHVGSQRKASVDR